MAIQTVTKEWEKIKLADVCVDTETVNPARHPSTQIKYVDVSAVSNKTLTIESHETLLGKDAPSRARKLIRENDTIFATVRPTLRRVALVTKEFDGDICSTGYCVVRSDEKKADANFIYFELCSDDVNDYVKGIQRGVSYPAISDNDLFRFTFALPELSEQETTL